MDSEDIKILNKKQDYIIEFPNGCSFSISEWVDSATGKRFFCRTDHTHCYDVVRQMLPSLRVGIHTIQEELPKFESIKDVAKWIKDN